ncbi:hypothetical protein D3C87_1342580 [compost metagenome]
MRFLAVFGPRDGLDRLRPSPARLKRDQPERGVRERDDFYPPLVEGAGLVGILERTLLENCRLDCHTCLLSASWPAHAGSITPRGQPQAPRSERRAKRIAFLAGYTGGGRVEAGAMCSAIASDEGANEQHE